MSHSVPRGLLAALLAGFGPITGCTAAERESSAALRGPDTSAANTQTRSALATAVCDSVAARWEMSNVTVTRSDSVWEAISMTAPVPACVVTAVDEDPDSTSVRRGGYWMDSTGRGWQGITRWDADGPDGSSRTLIRSGVRCQVDGEWDGGDDSSPSAPRSKRVTERTICWGDAGLTPRDTSSMP